MSSNDDEPTQQSVAREFRRWEVYELLGQPAARLRDTLIRVGGEDWADLRDKLIAAEKRIGEVKIIP